MVSLKVDTVRVSALVVLLGETGGADLAVLLSFLNIKKENIKKENKIGNFLYWKLKLTQQQCP